MMKLHHAAALALVGWYLMMPLPPIAHNTRSINPDSLFAAPLSRWSIIRTFPTQKECETYRDANPMELCVASDDPRLKEK